MHRPSIPIQLSLVALAAAGCVDTEPTDDTATAEQDVGGPILPPPLPPITLPSDVTHGGIDDDRYPMPVTDAPLRAELELISGRAARVPVSKAFVGSITVTGAHHLRLQTQGCVSTDDTGMLVTYLASGPHTYVNDDAAAAGGNGKCSMIDLGARTTTTTYAVHVWSQNRATSTVNIRQDLGQGAGWTTWRASEVVGGTLVSIGALASGEFVEVRTRSDGFDGVTRSDTRMLLFAAPADYAGSTTDHTDQSAISSDN